MYRIDRSGNDRMLVRVDGPFRVIAGDGTDITPKGMKERALLALLALSPGQRRTRVWLQDKLWSDREAGQASGSCRQALSNLRKALGPEVDRLSSDRNTVWLAPEVQVLDKGEGELLDDLDVRDPEFGDWLRDRRQAREDAARPQSLPLPHGPVGAFGDARTGAVPLLSPDAAGRPVVLIWLLHGATAPRSAFLLRALGQRIGGELILLGGFDVVQADGADRPPLTDPAAIIEIESYGEGDNTHALIQVLSAPGRRLGWSGRLELGGPLGDIWDAEAVTRAVNRTVKAVADLAATIPALRPLSALHHAVERIYEFDRTRLAKADDLLQTVQNGDLRGLALAWRGFVRLTWALEFRDHSRADEAEELVSAALREMGDHPVVLAIASQVRMKFSGDVDAARYLALRAAEIGDQNPYALDALSQSMIMAGDYAGADLLASRARRAAQGLAHSFNWDMQACLSALSVGRLEAARDAAAECHRKMPFYRPALRYLVALAFLLGQRAEAETYIARLRRLEPDFAARTLLAPDYPVDTLRALGLAEQLRSALE